MSRYIDANALLKSAVSKFKCVPSVGVIYCGNGEEIFDGEDLQDFIRAIPTADVVEVRHGQWSVTVIEKSDKVFRTGAPHCSLCGRQAHHRTPFCPNCGAKMDGERSENGT